MKKVSIILSGTLALVAFLATCIIPSGAFSLLGLVVTTALVFTHLRTVGKLPDYLED